MDTNYSQETAIGALGTAFHPLRCVVEVWDYDKKVRFRVFSPSDEPVFTMTEALMSQVRDAAGLVTIVAAARERIEAKGYKLDPWQPPKIES